MVAKRRNAWTAYAVTAVLALMLGVSYAAVPLYELFCQVTGFGGTTARVAAFKQGPISSRAVTVSFDSNISGDLPWTFEPVQRKVSLKIGAQTLVQYRAKNNGTQPVTGVATFNVTPHKAGAYFDKIECFCFTEQTLKPGETVDMPVVFYIDPAITKDRNLDDLSDIVLSYTFFRAERSASDRRQANLLNR
jgi:cytochrome c oxidase assembly protein subunit 11